MKTVPPDPRFTPWRLVQNKFRWWPTLFAALLWPVAVALPYKLAMPQGNGFTGLLQLFGVLCLFVAFVLWLGMIVTALYRRYWRCVGSLLIAIVVFFVVGGAVGYRL